MMNAMIVSLVLIWSALIHALRNVDQVRFVKIVIMKPSAGAPLDTMVTSQFHVIKRSRAFTEFNNNLPSLLGQ